VVPFAIRIVFTDGIVASWRSRAVYRTSTEVASPTSADRGSFGMTRSCESRRLVELMNSRGQVQDGRHQIAIAITDQDRVRSRSYASRLGRRSQLRMAVAPDGNP
jgi:hypothetical protein